MKWVTFVTLPIIYILTNISFFAVLSYDQISSAQAVGLVCLERGREGGRDGGGGWKEGEEGTPRVGVGRGIGEGGGRDGKRERGEERMGKGGGGRD